MRFTGPDHDFEAEFRADLRLKSVETVDESVYSWAKLLKLTPNQCEECMTKVREILKTYEYP